MKSPLNRPHAILIEPDFVADIGGGEFASVIQKVGGCLVAAAFFMTLGSALQLGPDTVATGAGGLFGVGAVIYGLAARWRAHGATVFMRGATVRDIETGKEAVRDVDLNENARFTFFLRYALE